MQLKKEFFTTGEVSRLIGISEKTVRNYCDSGKIVHQQTPITNFRRIPKESLIDFIKGNGLSIDLLEKELEKKFLVVEDEEIVLDIITEILKINFKDVLIETAMDGYEACIKAGIFIPDVVVLDLSLPKADGFEVCKSIRQIEKTKHAEIIVVSGYLDDENIEMLKSFDVKYIFPKPPKEDEFVGAVRQIFKYEPALV